MAKIRITDLLVRTIIGTNEWERDTRQDVVINIELAFDSSQASKTDDLKETVDYKSLTKRIIKEVEASQFLLLEKLTTFILDLVMQDKKVKEATVRVDKPHALRYAKSVSVELTGKR